MNTKKFSEIDDALRLKINKSMMYSGIDTSDIPDDALVTLNDDLDVYSLTTDKMVVLFENNNVKSHRNIIKIDVYCGETVEQLCRHQLHPVNEVKQAKMLVDLNKSTIVYSNSPDFISAIKYFSDMKKIDIEFHLNGKSCGDDIEPIFEDMNRSFKLIEVFL